MGDEVHGHLSGTYIIVVRYYFKGAWFCFFPYFLIIVGPLGIGPGLCVHAGGPERPLMSFDLVPASTHPPAPPQASSWQATLLKLSKVEGRPLERLESCAQVLRQLLPQGLVR